jgi:Tfp pilus assembly protein PilF
VDVVAPPSDPRLVEHLAAARKALARGDTNAAAEAARAARRINATDPVAAFYLGRAFQLQGRPADAQRAFESAWAGDDPFGLVRDWLDLPPTQPPPPPPTSRQIAAAVESERAARAALRDGDAERARKLAAEAVELDPGNLLAHHLLGRALLTLGHSEAARAAFEAARNEAGGLDLVDGWLAEAGLGDGRGGRTQG